MIPAAGGAWRAGSRLPMAGLHPAARLGCGLLAVLSALLLPALMLAPLFCVLACLLWRAGWLPGAQAARWRAWLPLALVVLAVHTVTATDTAPLGTPSWTGLGRGLIAVGRLVLMLLWAGLTMRMLPLPELSSALAWWLGPLRRFGYEGRHLNLALAVAAATATRTLDEAVRLRGCLRLRMSAARQGRRSFGQRVTGLRAGWLVVPPLMEGLVRRAESLPLALVGRVPQELAGTAALPWWQATALIAWTALLVLAVV